MTDQRPAAQAMEQLPITLFDSVVLAVRIGDGTIHLVLRDLCAAIGVDISYQRRRILATDSLHLTAIRLRSGTQLRELDCLALDDLALWLLGIQERRVTASTKERLVYVKRYLEAAVRKAFTDLVQLPDAPSATIEDLRDLDRIDPALAQLEALGQRQALLEQSQDRARTAFRDVLNALNGLQALPTELVELRQRVRELEQKLGMQITPAQRGTLYQAVQRWGDARAAQQPDDKPGVAMRRCWAEFNQRFKLASYSQLPAVHYDEAVQFVQDQYRTITGQGLAAAEQNELGF